MLLKLRKIVGRHREGGGLEGMQATRVHAYRVCRLGNHPMRMNHIKREHTPRVVHNCRNNVLARHPIADGRLAGANHSTLWQQRNDAAIPWLYAFRVDMPHSHGNSCEVVQHRRVEPRIKIVLDHRFCKQRDLLQRTCEKRENYSTAFDRPNIPGMVTSPSAG